MKSVIGAATVAAFTAIALSGCGTITQGTSQNIAITTSPPGGHCNLDRKGEHVATLDHAPGAVHVDKTKNDILMTCTLPGYQAASVNLESGYGIGTFGNVIAGGAIGWGIDSATGADNKYPSKAEVQFVPLAPGQTPPATQMAYTTSGSSVPCTPEQEREALLARQNGKAGSVICF